MHNFFVSSHFWFVVLACTHLCARITAIKADIVKGRGANVKRVATEHPTSTNHGKAIANTVSSGVADLDPFDDPAGDGIEIGKATNNGKTKKEGEDAGPEPHSDHKSLAHDKDPLQPKKEGEVMDVIEKMDPSHEAGVEKLPTIPKGKGDDHGQHNPLVLPDEKKDKPEDEHDQTEEEKKTDSGHKNVAHDEDPLLPKNEGEVVDEIKEVDPSHEVGVEKRPVIPKGDSDDPNKPHVSPDGKKDDSNTNDQHQTVEDEKNKAAKVHDEADAAIANKVVNQHELDSVTPGLESENAPEKQHLTFLQSDGFISDSNSSIPQQIVENSTDSPLNYGSPAPKPGGAERTATITMTAYVLAFVSILFYFDKLSLYT